VSVDGIGLFTNPLEPAPGLFVKAENPSPTDGHWVTYNGRHIFIPGPPEHFPTERSLDIQKPGISTIRYYDQVGQVNFDHWKDKTAREWASRALLHVANWGENYEVKIWRDQNRKAQGVIKLPDKTKGGPDTKPGEQSRRSSSQRAFAPPSRRDGAEKKPPAGGNSICQ
jgi:hypothetical protein